MKNCKKIGILFFLGIMVWANIAFFVQAASISYEPTSQFYINDFANVLDSSTENDVFNIARNIEEKTTAQLVVVTVPSLDGDSIEGYANTLFNQWKIGSSDKDNGVLLLVSSGDRKVRIEVGYGLEGAINDAKAGRILDDTAVPALKENDYNQAIKDTVVQLEGIIYKEYNVEGGFDNYVEGPMEKVPQVIITFIILGVFILLMVLSRGRGIFFFGPFGGGFGGGRFRRQRPEADSMAAVVLLAEAEHRVGFR